MKKTITVLVGIALLGIIGFATYSYMQSSKPVTLTESTPAPTTLYSLESVSEHNTKDDCWQAIDGVVYDFTPYLDSANHPGGNAMAKDCGTDATFTYENSPPHSDYARTLLPEYAIGIVE